MPGQRRRDGQHGFTLIEVIVVLVILGVLSAVIAPNYFSMVQESDTAMARGAASEGLGRLYSAVGLYYVHEKSRPTGLSQLRGDAYLGTDESDQLDLGEYRLSFSQTNGGESVRIAVEALTDQGGYRDTGVVLVQEWPME